MLRQVVAFFRFLPTVVGVPSRAISVRGVDAGVTNALPCFGTGVDCTALTFGLGVLVGCGSGKV
jgi:hypothetical protein